jgi:hypothetical protein
MRSKLYGSICTHDTRRLSPITLRVPFHRYMLPEFETKPWGTLETGLIDPFGNVIFFCERIAAIGST